MATRDAKDALLEVLSGLLDTDQDMGDTETSMPLLTEFVRAFADPDFTCAMVPLPPGPPAEYDGIEGLSAAWRDWGDAFETVRLEPEELREGAEAIVLLAKQVAITRHGGVEITQPSAMACLFSGGLVTRIEFHLDRETALRAGGL